MAKLIDQALKKTYFYEHTEADGLDMRLCLPEIEVLDVVQVYKLYASYLNKKPGKKSNTQRY